MPIPVWPMPVWPMPIWSRWTIVLLAGCALWLLLAGPRQLLGWDAGNLGMVLLMLSAWALIYAVSRIPGEVLMSSASPAEWHARIGLGFNLIAMVYFFAKLQVFNDAPLMHNPDAAAVGRNLVLLLVAWVVIAGVLASRWKGIQEQDERDREIAAMAAAWGRTALILCIAAYAVMLGFTPADRLNWATPPMVGQLLIFALMWGWLCEYVATLLYYRRDRREAA